MIIHIFYILLWLKIDGIFSSFYTTATSFSYALLIPIVLICIFHFSNSKIKNALPAFIAVILFGNIFHVILLFQLGFIADADDYWVILFLSVVFFIQLLIMVASWLMYSTLLLKRT
jgi:hypothetical protein